MALLFCGTRFRHTLVSATVLGLTAACWGGGAPTSGDLNPGQSSAAASELTGDVWVDGSSTVFPISEAMAEEFMALHPGVRITIGVSGSGGGFQKFCVGETDISNASRPINTEEIERCAQNGIDYVELPIAFDGISVVVNPANDWAQCLTLDDLRIMWEPAAEGVITNWNQIRPDFPDQPLTLYAPGVDSGTYDYFTDAIVGTESESRGDFTASEDDNVLVQGIAGDRNAIGFFGYAYYDENQDSLRLVAIDSGDGCIEPSQVTIADGTYVPLSRPEFLYVNASSLDNPAVRAFVAFQLDPANADLIDEVGYVPMPDYLNALAKKRLERLTLGSIYNGMSAVGIDISDLLTNGAGGGL